MKKNLLILTVIVMMAACSDKKPASSRSAGSTTEKTSDATVGDPGKSQQKDQNTDADSSNSSSDTNPSAATSPGGAGTSPTASSPNGTSPTPGASADNSTAPQVKPNCPTKPQINSPINGGNGVCGDACQEKLKTALAYVNNLLTKPNLSLPNRSKLSERATAANLFDKIKNAGENSVRLYNSPCNPLAGKSFR